LKSVYNVDPSFGNLLAVAVNLVGHDGVLDLADLDKHDAIEHDASLTRKNFAQGDNHSFQPDMFKTLMSETSNSTLGVYDLALARGRRATESLTEGGKALNLKSNTLAFGEAALILGVFGGESLEAPKDQLTTWFTEDKLPDGFQKPAKAFGLSDAMSVSNKIKALVPKTT
jgi:Peroxidase, family 2